MHDLRLLLFLALRGALFGRRVRGLGVAVTGAKGQQEASRGTQETRRHGLRTFSVDRLGETLEFSYATCRRCAGRSGRL